MWSPHDILDPIRVHLERENESLRAQQAVRGLDSLREIDLHPLISQAFSDAPTHSLREVYYPNFETELPKGPQRDRCDLVLLEAGKNEIYDPVDAHKKLQSASGTLFEPVASLPDIEAHECEPTDAFWVEIKIIAQNRYIEGVPVPNAKYAHELLSGPRTDVIKLAAEPFIRHAGVLVVIFTEHEEAGIHDLSMAMREMIDQDLPVGMPEYTSLPIVDHAGNAWCTLGLIPLKL
ncbi:MAG: hypothetical protein ACF8MF_05390 [Phycisphaerales bacterium JB052]